MSILCLLTSSHLLMIFATVTILGNARRPHKQYPNIVDNSLHHVYSFFLNFPEFLVIFQLTAILGNAHTACKQCTNIVNNDLHLSLYLFLIFPEFLSIFTLVTILGNAHRPCKLYLNTINKYTSCLSFFRNLYFIFLLSLHELPYLEVCTDHVKSTPTSSAQSLFFSNFITIFHVKIQNFPCLAFLAPFWTLASTVSPVPELWGPFSGRSYIMSILFLLIFLHFLIIFASITILGNVHRPCKSYSNSDGNGLCHATPHFPVLLLMFWLYLH